MRELRQPTVALRPVTPGDRPFLAQVYASTREQELSAVPFSAAEKAAFLEQQFTAQSLHYERSYVDTTFDVVVIDGEDAGRLIVGRWADQVRVVDITLLPPFRGGGVGRRLLTDVIDEAEAAGVSVSIYVERNNPAQRLYARLGFELASEDPNGLHLFLERRPLGAPHAPRARPNSVQANTAS